MSGGEPGTDPSFDFSVTYLWEQILEFLNKGGTKQAAITAYRQQYSKSYSRVIQEKDVTGDGISELLFAEQGKFAVYICDGDQINVKWAPVYTYHYNRPVIATLIDMNLDAVPEIITISGDERIRMVSVVEWDGGEFQALECEASPDNEQNCSTLYGSSWAYAIDTDNNGTLELVLKQDIPIWSEYSMGLPWRKETRTYMWNGTLLAFAHMELFPPEYRFQAVQDGDRAALAGEYVQALDLYQQAIFSDQLDWWSLDRYRYELNTYGTEGVTRPTPKPSLLPDPLEYPHLAAYARFRILLLHLLRGYLPEAQTVYDTLQVKFPVGQPGHAFAETAQAFWEDYQASQDIGQACGKAVDYAAAHEDILAYLGSYYHGWQSRIYKPEDVCPFK